MRRRISVSTTLALLMALMMVTSPVAMAAGGAVGVADDEAEQEFDIETVQTQSSEDVEIQSELEAEASSGGTVEVFVRMDAAESAFYQETVGVAQSADSQAALEQQATVTQAPLEAYADRTAGVETVSEFWLTNAVLVELDTNEVSLDALARVDGVTELHPNYEVNHVSPDAEAMTDVEPTDHGLHTYGLEQVNAPNVWDEFENKGDGVTVAVIDTGLNADHEQFDDYDESNWAEFAFDGSEIDSEPYDLNGHGTHVAGTILGGEADSIPGQPHIGVAPEAELLSINVFPGMPEEGSTTLASIVAGMEHAVEEEADVANLSLGGGGYAAIYIDVIRNAQAAGTHIVSSSGNDGIGAEGTPANVYDATAVGATDATEDIAAFSTGTEIDTAEEWGYVAPDDWPDEYITPDVSAPGVGVISSYAGGEDAYASLQGTSMAAPHTTGVVALLMAEYDTEPTEVKTVLEETATKPHEPGPGAIYDAQMYDSETDSNQIERLYDDDVRDIRYGYGIIDAYAASVALEAETGTLEGTVEDDGEPVSGIEVTFDDENVPSVHTDDDGEFAVDLLEGTYTVSASDHGLAVNEDVEITAGETTTATLELEPTVDAVVVDDQPPEVATGDSFDVSFDVANLETYTVDVGDDVDAADVTVELAGEEIDLGEPVSVEDDDLGALTVTTTADAGETVALEHTFEGEGDEEQLLTGPTEVLGEDAESAGITVANYEPPAQALYGDADIVSATFENTGDFTESDTVYLYLDDEDGSLVQVDETIPPGESTTVDFANFGWYSDLRGDAVPGDLESQVSVGDAPTLHNESNEPVDESDVKVTSVEEPSAVSGTVTDVDTGEAMAGVDVLVEDDEGQPVAAGVTDSDGEYEIFAGLVEGEYTVVAETPGFGSGAASVTFDEIGDVETADFELGTDATFSFEMEAGETYALGVPGPIEGGTVGDIVSADEEGVIYTYDADENSWDLADASTEVAALDALAVVPGEDIEATVEFAGQPGNDETPNPPTRSVSEGWNFVAPSVYAEADEAFQLSSSEIAGVLQTHEEPESAMVPTGGFEGVEILNEDEELLNPFSGYFVFAQDEGQLGGTIYEGVTLDTAYQNLDIDAERFSGQVTSSVGGEAVSGATVDVEGVPHETTTDDDGNYTLPPLPAGEPQNVSISAGGFVASDVEATPDDADFELQDEVYFAVTDLEVQSTEFGVGDEFEVSYEVENLGVEPAEQEVVVAIGADMTNPRTDADTYVVEHDVVELEPGDSYEMTVTETVGDFQPTGDQYLGVVTEDDVVSEEVTVLPGSEQADSTSASSIAPPV